MFSIFAYYFAQTIVGCLPIKFGDSEFSSFHCIIHRSSTRESSDEEEAHSLVEESDEDDIEIARQKKKEFLGDSDDSSKLRKFYILSALLDIAGYVIRTMGYC